MNKLMVLKVMFLCLYSSFVIALVGSCGDLHNTHSVHNSDFLVNTQNEKIMGTVEQGLHKVIIDDTVVVLLYRGTKSCTMIQLN